MGGGPQASLVSLDFSGCEGGLGKRGLPAPRATDRVESEPRPGSQVGCLAATEEQHKEVKHRVAKQLNYQHQEAEAGGKHFILALTSLELKLVNSPVLSHQTS